MFKFISAIILIVGIGVLALMGAGYRFQPQYLHYYTDIKGGGDQHEVVLNNGVVLNGVIESETDTAIRFNMDGAITEFSKAGIKSTKSQTSDNFFITFINNAEKHNKIHPLLIKDPAKSLIAGIENFMNEPSRLAEDIKKKNPGVSQTEELERQMRANAQARLNDYKARVKEAEEGG